MSALNPEKLSPQTSSLKDLHSKHLPPPPKASQIALPETKFASPPPSFLVREAVPRLPSREGNLGRPSQFALLGGQSGTKSSQFALLEGNLGHFWPGRADWDAFGERPSLPSFTTLSVSLIVCLFLCLSTKNN